MKESKRRKGTGQIFKDGDGFRAVDPVTHQRRRFASEAEAEAWLSGQLRKYTKKGIERYKNDGYAAPQITYGRFWKAFYQPHVLPRKPPNTARIERGAWGRLNRWQPDRLPVWPSRRIADIKEVDILQYIDFQEAEGLSRATIAQDINLLRSMARQADRLKVCRTPDIKWHVPGPVARKVEVISDSEYRSLLAQANPLQRAMLVWYWDTGCRPNELLAIRRADFDPDEALVWIPTLKTARKTGVALRPFQMTAEMVTGVQTRDRWLSEIVETGVGEDSTGPRQAQARLESEWVFPSKSGQRMANDGHRQALRSCFERAGVRHLDFYRFRHTYCTRWLQNGGDPVFLAKLVGTSLAMIDKTYAHAQDGYVRSVQRKMKQGQKPVPIRKSESSRKRKQSTDRKIVEFPGKD